MSRDDRQPRGEAQGGRSRPGPPEGNPSPAVGAALRTLYDVGGHILPTVLARDPGGDPDKLRKIPARKGWQLRRMKPETAIAHLRRPLPPDRPDVVEYGLGIIPDSLGSVVADLDVGERRVLWEIAGEPWECLSTRRGSHSFYDYDGPELTRRGFKVGGCRGELIGARQFVQFHGLDAIVRLAEALPRRGAAALQLEIFDLVGVEAPARRRRRVTAKHKATGPIPCPGDLAAAAVGIRHRTLFWWGRHWAYREPRGGSFGTWERRVRVQFSGLHIAMPEPRLPAPEVERMASDVAAWVWDREPLSRPWVAQFFRGVKREYGAVTPGRVDGIWRRNRRMVEAVEGGRSRKAVARDAGLSPRMVRKILRNAETWLSPDAKAEALGAIWGPDNPPPTGGFRGR